MGSFAQFQILRMKIHKQNKFLFYVKGFVTDRLPTRRASAKISGLKFGFSEQELAVIEERVEYYNRIDKPKSIEGKTQVRDLLKPRTPKSYFFDTYRYARYFGLDRFIDYVFGDVIEVPATPSVVKSRPIQGSNENSVLLKLNQARHFIRVGNDKPFLEKKNLLIGRCAIFQEHRYEFFKMYFGHPLTDLRQVNGTGGNPSWVGPKISIKDHLDFKFILSLEGNDVATNLKWIMSSNSIAVMPKPKYETWFMEGKLIGGVHYIEIKDDYSDLIEKLTYYIENPKECLQILENAQKHSGQFRNKKSEDLCNLLVLQRYFEWCRP